MKVVYSMDTGELMDAYYDVAWFAHFREPSTPYGTLEIDEVAPDNRDLCRAVARSIGRVDVLGRQRFYVRGGQLWERENWQEYIED